MIQRCSYWLDFIHYFVKDFEEKLKTYLGFWFVFGDLTKFHPLSFVRLYRLYRDYPELCVDVRFPWYCFVSTQSKQYQQPALAKTFLLFYTFVLLLSNRNNIKFGQKPPLVTLFQENSTLHLFISLTPRGLLHTLWFLFSPIFLSKNKLAFFFCDVLLPIFKWILCVFFQLFFFLALSNFFCSSLSFNEFGLRGIRIHSLDR